jgi:hypothetical protein
VYKYLRKTSKTAEQAGLSLSTIFFSWLSLHFEFINITCKMKYTETDDLLAIRLSVLMFQIWIQLRQRIMISGSGSRNGERFTTRWR